jgi:response regulator NasT
MRGPYRIAIGSDDSSDLAIVRDCLISAGYSITAEAHSLSDITNRCRDATPDLAVVDVSIPGSTNAADVSKAFENVNCPLILVLHQGTLIDDALDISQAFGCISSPIRKDALFAAIIVARLRFHEMKQLREEAASIRQALEDRATIERAKSILMRRRGVDEPTAFAQLQKLSRDNRKKLVEVARQINLADEVLPVVAPPHQPDDTGSST